jgi:hypothetical protein
MLGQAHGVRGHVTARPYILAETTWKGVRQTTYDVAVLPWGATEAHSTPPSPSPLR